jgi:heme/copper-type cytochrome/quinol oxidase subunit 3
MAPSISILFAREVVMHSVGVGVAHEAISKQNRIQSAYMTLATVLWGLTFTDSPARNTHASRRSESDYT